MSLSLSNIRPEMCSERDSPLQPFVLPAPGQPELARLICGAHLSPPVLTRKQKRPWVNSLVCDQAAAFCTAEPPEVLSRMSRLVTQATERERKLARARSQRLKQAAWSLAGESVSRGFAGRGALEGYPSHYTSLIRRTLVGNKIVDHSDVVGASPVGTAPTTSSFSTYLASLDWAKTTARRDEKHLSFGIGTYIRDFMVINYPHLPHHINTLTHWPLGDAAVILNSQFSNSYQRQISWAYEIALRWKSWTPPLLAAFVIQVGMYIQNPSKLM